MSVCRGHRQGGQKEQTQTFNMQKLTNDDQEGEKRAKKPVIIFRCGRPPSTLYYHAYPPLGSDGALGQSGKRQHNQSKQAA